MRFLKYFVVAFLLSLLLIAGNVLYQVHLFESGWEDLGPGDCLLVMGSKVLDNNRPDLMMRERVDTALKHVSNDTRYIFVTGGSLDHRKTEAEVSRGLFIQGGTDPRKIVLEDKSTSSYQNLLYSKPLLEEKKCEKVDIVSHGFHLSRVGMTARRLEIPYHRLIPAELVRPDPPRLIRREYLAYLAYWLAWDLLEDESDLMKSMSIQFDGVENTPL